MKILPDRPRERLSLIDKGIASMGTPKIKSIITANTMMQKPKMSFEDEVVLLCRMGGDEFAMFFPEIISEDHVVEGMGRAQERFAHEVGGDDIPVACSAGILFVSERQGQKFTTLYERADMALYSAKRHAKGSICVSKDEQGPEQHFYREGR